MCVLFDVVCVRLLRYTDTNVHYSMQARTGHGQVNITFEDSVRVCYLCWYCRDQLLSWRREMVPADNANRDPEDPDHALDQNREFYYYRVSFVDDRCKQTGAVPGGRFGMPLDLADRFPGWDVAQAHWQGVWDRNLVMVPVRRVWRLL